MRNILAAAATVFAIMLFPGCLGVHIGIGGGHRHDPPPVIVVPGDPVAASVEIAEIDGAMALTFDNDRRDVLKRIAERPGLSPGGQVYLVQRSLEGLSFDNAKEEILLALIRNPGFAPDAEACILNNLAELTFESHKRRVLDEIDRVRRTRGAP